MALKLKDGSTFLHVPRTGGTFITAVLRTLDLSTGGVGRKHDVPGAADFDMRRPRHAFVRHPYSWIKSVWGYQHQFDWPVWPKPAKDDRWWHPFREICQPPDPAQYDFEAFIDWLVEMHPGFWTRTMMKFVDWPMTAIYRTETVQASLILLCRRMDVADADVLRAMQKCRGARNAAPGPETMVDAALLNRFYDSETTGMILLDYERKYDAEA